MKCYRCERNATKQVRATVPARQPSLHAGGEGLPRTEGVEVTVPLCDEHLAELERGAVSMGTKGPGRAP